MQCIYSRLGCVRRKTANRFARDLLITMNNYNLNNRPYVNGTACGDSWRSHANQNKAIYLAMKMSPFRSDFIEVGMGLKSCENASDGVATVVLERVRFA